MTFTPLQPRESAVDACAKRLRETILSGDLSPGERLPPERALAETFGVHRVTLRSALAHLEAEKLVSVRQGSGYVVRDFRREGSLDLVPALLSLGRRGASMVPVARDLLMVRRSLARSVLQLLARGVTARDLERISDAVTRLAAVVDEGSDVHAIARADGAVVSALVDATKSDVLCLCLNPVVTLARELEPLRDAMYRNPSANVAGWRMLTAWLELRDENAIDHVIAALEAIDEQTILHIKPRRSR